MALGLTYFAIDTTMDGEMELREPQGKIKNMKIVEEREAWIHTHFILDSFYITDQERRQISISVEPELMQLGLQYGLTYNIAPSKHRAIIVLECIPFDSVKAVIKQLINNVIEDFPVRLPEQRNVVTNITVADSESSELTDSESPQKFS